VVHRTTGSVPSNPSMVTERGEFHKKRPCTRIDWDEIVHLAHENPVRKSLMARSAGEAAFRRVIGPVMASTES
jgi:hypothetical protein